MSVRHNQFRHILSEHQYFGQKFELARFILSKMLIFTVEVMKLLMPYRHHISVFYCCDSYSTLKVSFALFQSNFKVISVLNERI